jgi:AcrR family transcriptional regulator
MRQAEEVRGAEDDVLEGGVATDEEMGRRERKKAQTRQALIDAAWELFDERGYAETTIEDITDRVDVSSRTFFRYFPSKEAVVFAEHEGDDKTELLADALAQRPADEPVLESIRAALHVLTQELADDPEHALRVGRLCRENPSLEEYRHGAGSQTAEDALLGFLRSRLDDPMAPVVISSALKGALMAAWDYWIQSDQQLDMTKLLDQAIDALEQGFRT